MSAVAAHAALAAACPTCPRSHGWHCLTADYALPRLRRPHASSLLRAYAKLLTDVATALRTLIQPDHAASSLPQRVPHTSSFRQLFANRFLLIRKTAKTSTLLADTHTGRRLFSFGMHFLTNCRASSFPQKERITNAHSRRRHPASRGNPDFSAIVLASNLGDPRKPCRQASQSLCQRSRALRRIPGGTAPLSHR